MKTLIKEPDLWAKLFKKILNLKLSERFVECMAMQLTQQYVAATGSELNNKQQLSLFYYTSIDFTYGEISSIPGTLYIPRAILEVTIGWKSESGRVYDIGDEDIDCNDLKFWFIDLDLEKCKKLDLPPDPKLLFLESEYDFLVERVKQQYNMDYNPLFFECANKSISDFFELRTGIKVNRHIKITELMPNYEKGTTSKLGVHLSIMASQQKTIQLCWKSKSGRIYDLADQDIDCNDLEFWLEGLQPEIYLKELYYYSSAPALPFQLKDLSYKLTVRQIMTDCEMAITLKNEAVKNAEELLNGIYNFINDYNKASEKKDRKAGVIHNANGSFSNNQMILKIDIGSVGPTFFKKLFKYFSSLNAFEEVVVD